MTACGHKAKVISEDKFVKIYMDMFIADQWLEANYTEKKAADTLLFYDPIFEKYGYDREDYFKTVDYYLRDPQKYLKVMKKVQSGLTERVKGVEKELEIYSQNQANKAVDKGVVRFSEEISKLQFNDTIFLQKNEKGIYSIMPIEFDTVFKGPAIIVKEQIDTTVTDSLAVDSLAIDSLPKKIDSAKVEPIKVAPLTDKERIRPDQGRPVRNPKAGVVKPTNRDMKKVPLEELKK